jgi:hypothetical protein
MSRGIFCFARLTARQSVVFATPVFHPLVDPETRAFDTRSFAPWR